MAATAPSRTDRATALAGLLARTARADQAAFGELYRQTSALLYAVAVRITRDRGIAEELLQEAYVGIWNRAGSYDAAKSQPLTWLTSVVRNRCLDHLRRKELDTVTLTFGADDGGDGAALDLPSDGPGPVELLQDGAAAQQVRECLDALEGPHKQAIALAFFHGLTHAELARHLRQPLGTVKSWIRRGLERLKRCLDRGAAA
jgi:RNA polymerase sigma-70 factor (ECF subfamily)